ncbi:tRNA (guanine-N(7)-)-methyltransferase non-catalytic subunit WDR4 [Halyomorpha halys]|uniref:tRNA (guanine-N(7)-)-methyltransferase non-catalytic subunit WDR4 n=1 Tax=Halyomorpha halys TaxID=286706 RepID=UPI0006D4F69A|nr:tRNA (guanine-N(7)-)-methyltransferase non-catalytic subunit WDR4 [Halyomorpha halys]
MLVNNMIDLSVSSQFITVSNETHSLAIELNPDQSSAHEFNRPKDIIKENASESFCETFDGNAPIVSSSFSSCGKLFVCCCHKDLSLWNVGDWKLIGKKTIQRSANKVLFTPRNNVIVADKSGDVYLHLLADFNLPGSLLLGHVSMLLDVLVTPNEKYIITCDRDEKIRVSLFPKSYIINSYCLGHEDFITYIHLIPHDPSMLVSSGGDGTIRFWSYEVGTELLVHSLRDDISNLKKEEVSQIVSHRGLVSAFDSNSSLLFSSVFKVNSILVHMIINSGNNISCNLWRVIETDHTPLCFKLNEPGMLWTILHNETNPLVVFEIKSDGCNESNSSVVEKVREAFKKYPEFFKNIDIHERFISSLAKKRFDNEGEYYKRKKERLSKKPNVKRIAS